MIAIPTLQTLISKKSLKGKLQTLKTLLAQKVQVNPHLSALWHKSSEISLYHEIAFFSVLAIGQEAIVLRDQEVTHILDKLALVERFYQAIGGLIGYHLKALELMGQKKAEDEKKSYKNPHGFDVREKNQTVQRWVLKAIQDLEKTAFIYPIGGLGDRLNLKDSLGKPLPVATLIFNGRSLLEGLIRDLQALEYLHYKIYHKQITIPVAFMTSNENDNEAHIRTLCENQNWFFRPFESFTLFSQISVPVVAQNGNWSMRSEKEINLQPGGHGAIWHMALAKGVFSRFLEEKKSSLIIRQINNPICGLDDGILAFLGCALKEEKTFGFVSCQRAENAAEGVLVLIDNQRISNIEYTDFKRYGIQEGPDMWANTNILFADIAKVLPLLDQNPLPGLILNMKSDVPFIAEDGAYCEVKGGRLESMMQNLSDSVIADEAFVLFNERKKTISVTKRSYESGKSPFETPVGAFADLMENGKQLLMSCGFKVEGNPLFSYHPALGPLYSIIRQKLKGGQIDGKSELNLEIAEILIENLHLNGSLIVEAKDPLGGKKEGLLRYGPACGKCRLINVQIENDGIDKQAPNIIWKGTLSHLQKCQIILEGSGEFVAENITLRGNFEIVVPHNERWSAFEKEGTIFFKKQKIKKPSWHWEYQILEEELVLFEGSTSQRLSLQEKLSQLQDRRKSLITQ